MAELAATKPLIKKKKKKSNKMSFITEKRKNGRPKEFIWQNHKQFMEEGFAQGLSLKEIVSKLNVSYDHFLRLKDSDEGFGRFVAKGQMLSECNWIARGRDNLSNRSFNAHLYQLMMMNLHNWGIKNKTEATVKVKEVPTIFSSLSDDLIDKLLESE